MTQPYKICPQCQQSAVIDASQCQRCGRLYRSTAPQLQPQLTQTFTAPVRKPATFLAFVNTCAKWGAIAFSVLFIGALPHAIKSLGEDWKAGEVHVGVLAIGYWTLIWLAVAGPCAVAYLLTRPKA